MLLILMRKYDTKKVRKDILEPEQKKIAID